MPSLEQQLLTRERRKFSDPDVTADGKKRAEVAFRGFQTLWFNTGTLCNLECLNCYIESSPRNDRLVYLTLSEVTSYLIEADSLTPPPAEIGFTGGEPFMNPDIMGMLDESLRMGFKVLVLTNAMKPMHRHKAALLEMQRQYPAQLALRVSLDHYRQAGHEELRGPRSWEPAIAGLKWLSRNDFAVSVAGRMIWGETTAAARDGYRRLYSALEIGIDANDPGQTILFPEMDEQRDVAEITGACWQILGVDPSTIMCATSRMVVKRKGEASPQVAACTLIPYDPAFDMGRTLVQAAKTVKLNHPHCARFCVLGGGSCSQAT